MTISRWLLPLGVTAAIHSLVAALPYHFGSHHSPPVEDSEPPPKISFRLVAAPKTATTTPAIQPPAPPPRSAPVPPPKNIKPVPLKRIPPRPKKKQLVKTVAPQPPPKPATKAIEAPVATPAPAAVTIATPVQAPPQPVKKVDLRGYGRRITAAVRRHLRYPQVAERLGLEGKTRVKISLNLQGQLLGSPTVYRSSGHPILDREALRIVRVAAPFAPLPSGMTRPSISIVITIKFTLPS